MADWKKIVSSPSTGFEMDTGSTMIWEGHADDDHQTMLTAGTVTQDNTVTLPNATGTVALTSDIPAGDSIITSGTATPSGISSHTPNNGDIYIEINEHVGDGTADTTGLAGNEYPFRIYVRDSDSRLLVLEPASSNSSTIKMKEKYNTGPVPFLPTATNIRFCTSGGTTINSLYYQVGSAPSLHALVTYNSDVEDEIDAGVCRALFAKSGSTQYKNFDTGTDDTRTSSANTYFATLPTDGAVSVAFDANTGTEDDVSIINDAGTKTIYARNDRIWGVFSGSITAAKILHDATGANNQVSSSTSYKSFGTKIFDVGQGDHVYFGIPDGASPISSVYVNGGSTNQFSAFTEVDLLYENASGYEETYTIWYTEDGQGDAPGSSFQVS